MASLFQKLELEAFRAGINPRTEESRNWFRAKAQRLTKVNRMGLMNSEEVKLVNKSQGLIGSMNMFFYDPKHKDTLPFYDRFPLTIISGPAEGGGEKVDTAALRMTTATSSDGAPGVHPPDIAPVSRSFGYRSVPSNAPV